MLKGQKCHGDTIRVCFFVCLFLCVSVCVCGVFMNIFIYFILFLFKKYVALHII